MQGFLLVDKPIGISSFGVVAKVRGIIKAATGNKIKVGHSGTLDPAASGLLVLAIGAYTKRITQLIKQDKTYLVEMTLGQTSSTGDNEGDLKSLNKHQPSLMEIKTTLNQFTGSILQTPPAFSAIKVNGVRAYKLAHKGQPVIIPPRQVIIYDNKLLNYHYPVVTFETAVSSGTYIRSLVEDIGNKLATGAYTSQLRRLKVGEYQVDSATLLKDLTYENINELLINY